MIGPVVFWSSLILVGLAVLAETALRNFRWPALEILLGEGRRRERFERLLKRERLLLDGLITLRLLGTFTLLFAVTGLFGPNDGLGAVENPEQFLKDLAIALVLYLVVLLGLVRGLARALPEKTLLRVLPGMAMVARAVFPLVWLTDVVGRSLCRLMGIREAEASEVARQEILNAVTEGERGGAIDDDGREMIENIIEVQDQQVTTIMTPRTQVFAVEAQTPFADAVRRIVEEGHSRVPVFSGTIDNVQGIVFTKDLLRWFGRPAAELPALRDVMRTPLFVPETKKTADLLEELRKDQVHMAIVIDEYGGMSGVLTIEDILEEIVGEIEDEYDPPAHLEIDPVLKLDEQTAEVGGQVHIDELNDVMSLSLPEGDGYDTIGGFISTRLGRMPERGETHDLEGVRFEILEADARRIARVRVVAAG